MLKVPALLGGLWLLAQSPNESRMMLFRHLVFAGLIAAEIIAPWTIRNSLIHHIERQKPRLPRTCHSQASPADERAFRN